MRLTAITAAVLAGAGIVGAVPIRVIMVSSSIQEAHPLDGVRFGHGVEQPPAVAKMMTSIHPTVRRPCSGRVSRFRQKGIEISNAFRGVLGLPLIDPNAHHAPHAPTRGAISILPMNPEKVQFLKPVEPSPDDKYIVEKHDSDSASVKWFKPIVAEDMRNHSVPARHRGHHHGFHHQHKNIPFINRLHYSLMNLGLWEGRAVAFVLGCGIGVLLRMFWVLAIVALRFVKRRPEEEDDYNHITVFEAVEVAPPNYTYPVDEKVAIEADTKVTEPAAAAATATEETK